MVKLENIVGQDKSEMARGSKDWNQKTTVL